MSSIFFLRRSTQLFISASTASTSSSRISASSTTRAVSNYTRPASLVSPRGFGGISSSSSFVKFYSTKSSSDAAPPPPPATEQHEATTSTAASSSIEPELSAELPTSTSDPAVESTSTPPTPAASEAVVPTQSLAEQYLELSDLPPPRKERFPGNTTSARSRSTSSKSTNEKRRAAMTRSFAVGGVLALVAGAAFLSRDWDDEGEMMRLVGRSDDATSVKDAELGGLRGRLARAKIRAEDHLDYLNKPAWEPLIPPPLPEPHGRPYTLIVDLDDLLVHSVWDRDHGWRTAKRPGVDYFLAYLSQFYEIVLFTTQPSYTAAPIVEKLDPYGAYIPWKLYRESTRYKNKSLIKDLSYLGRPLSRTIILDTSPEHVQLQPSNAIVLEPWTGSRSDATSRELISLIPFLEALAIQAVPDVRPVIEHYKGKHIPTAYAEAEQRERTKVRAAWEEERESREGKEKWKRALFGAMGGKKASDEPPELYIELARKHAQRLYLEEQKFWKDNEALIKQQMEDDRQRQLKEMKGSLMDYIGGFKPPTAPAEGSSPTAMA